MVNSHSVIRQMVSHHTDGDVTNSIEIWERGSLLHRVVTICNHAVSMIASLLNGKDLNDDGSIGS